VILYIPPITHAALNSDPPGESLRAWNRADCESIRRAAAHWKAAGGKLAAQAMRKRGRRFTCCRFWVEQLGGTGMRLSLRRRFRARRESETHRQSDAEPAQGFFAAPAGKESELRSGESLLSSHLLRAVWPPLKIAGTLSEIAIDRQRDEKRRQAQKMETIGRLASGVAHDFNNLLSIIIGYADLMLESFPEDSPNRTRADGIGKAARRAADLTKQVLTFSRCSVTAPRVVDPNAVVIDAEKLLRRLIPENIELLASLAPDIGRILADPVQVDQIILNLAINAKDAMPKGGTLRIETANAQLDETYAQKYPPVKPGRYVQLAVIDSGSGMDRSTQLHLFEPFFTTKKRGKGTGLGLATTYEIVKQMGGYIWVYSEPGIGTTIKVYLPRTEKELIDMARTPNSRRSLRGRETILLVEDVDFLRATLRDILKHSGYTVLDTASGRAALKAAASHRGVIHLILSDVVMPEMSGPEFAREAQKVLPLAKIIFMSGYPKDLMRRHGVEQSVPVLLQKPFTRDALLRSIRDVLDGTLEHSPLTC